MLSFFPRGVLDEILNLIESVSYSYVMYQPIFVINIIIHMCLQHSNVL